MKTEIIRRKRVLVVEDDAVFRDWANQVLERQGYSVAHCNNGAEAMSLFSKSSFDVVVADYKLPFMTGDEVAQRIKTIAPQQPVIIVTGDSTFRCRDSSADAVLFKPFEAGELGRVVERLLLQPEPTS
jgi:OmpR-family two-component system manganese-sensing response regulator